MLKASFNVANVGIKKQTMNCLFTFELWTMNESNGVISNLLNYIE